MSGCKNIGIVNFVFVVNYFHLKMHFPDHLRIIVEHSLDQVLYGPTPIH